jgi:ribosome biogenesis GTPase
MTGIVYKSTGSWYHVKDEQGQMHTCKIKGKFKIQGIKSTNPLAVGDVVDFELDQTTDQVVGMINKIHDRKNYIVRKSVNLSKQTHIIASNIDVLFLVVTIHNPITTTSFIDRFLVTAEAYSIHAVLVFNKIDTFDEDVYAYYEDLKYMYENIGYSCLSVSAKTGEGIDDLKAMMTNQVCMFSGHSGVGKSTLVNAIDVNLNLKTKEISNLHQQGQHTTTFAEMYDLPNDSKIIDTPGIRGFGLFDMEKEEISDYFPEFFALKKYCKFNNCLHVDEPHCAIKKALEENGLFPSRYESYLKILAGDEDQHRQDHFAQEKEESKMRKK